MYKGNVQPVKIHHHVKIAKKWKKKLFGITNIAYRADYMVENNILGIFFFGDSCLTLIL